MSLLNKSGSAESFSSFSSSQLVETEIYTGLVGKYLSVGLIISLSSGKETSWHIRQMLFTSSIDVSKMTYLLSFKEYFAWFASCLGSWAYCDCWSWLFGNCWELCAMKYKMDEGYPELDIHYSSSWPQNPSFFFLSSRSNIRPGYLRKWG